MKYLLLLSSTLLLSTQLLFAQGKEVSAFLENVGQIHDQKGFSRNDVDYVLHSKGMNVFIGKGKIIYQYANGTAMQRVEAQLKGAQINTDAIAGDQLEYYENHYRGNKLMGRAHTFKKVVYRNVYPHIDWILKINNDNSFEYEFAVGTLGNPDQIAIEYRGSSSVSLDKDGNLIVQSSMGSIKEHAPETFTANGAKLKSSYFLQGNTLRFHTDPYEGALVIDPKVVWATHYGDSTLYVKGSSSFTDIKYNGKGSLYASGGTTDMNNIATVGAYQTSIVTSGTSKVTGMYVKMDTNGNRLYATYFGVPPGGGGAISVQNDTVYLTGGDFSNTLGTTGVAQPSFAPFLSAPFLAKFDPSGILLWCTYCGANNKYASAAKCIIDPANNIYVFSSNDIYSPFVATAGAFKTTHSGGKEGADAIIIKYNSNGQKIWGTYYGGKGDEAFFSAVYMENDLKGTLYIIGNTTSDTGIATPGAYKTTLSSTLDAMIVKFDTSGKRLWGTYVGGDTTDNTQAICQDGNKNIYISGATSSKTGISTTGAYQPSHGGYSDMFVMKFSSGGSRLWGTYFGASGDDIGYGLCNDKMGNVFVCGKTSSATKIADTCVFQKNYGGGGADGCIAAFTKDGKKLWSSYLGGEGNDELKGIISDNKNIYIVGTTFSQIKNVATKGSFLDTNANGNQKGIMMKISGSQDTCYREPASSIGSLDKEQSELRLYPNPNNGTFEFESNITPFEKAQLFIRDVMGKTVWTHEVKSNSSGDVKEKLNISGLSKGLYILHIQCISNSNSLKFVIE